jgi:hypothetical protein
MWVVRTEISEVAVTAWVPDRYTTIPKVYYLIIDNCMHTITIYLVNRDHMLHKEMRILEEGHHILEISFA